MEFGSNSTEQKASYQANVAHARDSKVRSLLTGDDTRPITPVTKGKRMVHGSSSRAEAPFATTEAANASPYGGQPSGGHSMQAASRKGPIPMEEMGFKSHVAKKAGPTGADKIGAGGFDPDVYRQARYEVANNLANQKSKAYHGAGNIFQYGNPE